MSAGTVAPVLGDRRSVVLRLGAGAAALALAGVALHSLPSLDEVRARLGDADPAWIAAALALEAGSCLAFVAVYRGVFCRRLPWRTAYDVGMAVQGTNVLMPAGGVSGLAVGALVLRRTGVSPDRLARRTVAFFLITSSVNFLTAVLAGGALALGLLPSDAPVALTAGPAAAAVLAMVGVVVAARPLARVEPQPGTGRVRRAAATAARSLASGVAETGTLIRSGDVAVLAGAVGYMALDLAALAAAFAAIGAVPPVGVLLLGYVVGQLGGIVPLPGGVGGADGGLIAALSLYGTPLAGAAAAVLAYRAFQLGLPAVLGAVAVARLPRIVDGVV